MCVCARARVKLLNEFFATLSDLLPKCCLFTHNTLSACSTSNSSWGGKNARIDSELCAAQKEKEKKKKKKRDVPPVECIYYTLYLHACQVRVTVVFVVVLVLRISSAN